MLHTCEGKIQELQLRISQCTYSLLWNGSSEDSLLAARALDKLSSQQYFRSCLKSADSGQWLFVSDIHNQFAIDNGSLRNILSFKGSSVAIGGEATSSSSSSGSSRQGVNTPTAISEKSLLDPHETVWDTENMEYETWVCKLMTRICHDCYVCKRINEMIRVSNNFASAFVDMVPSNFFLSQDLFPLVLWDIVSTNGADSKVCEVLASQMSKYVLDTKRCKLLKATQLVCHSLVFILRQYINRHQELSSTSANAAGPMVSIGYKIDLKKVAAAAAHCGCGNTALFLIEAGQDSAELPTAHTSDVDINTVLCDILAEGNDPDALYGLCPNEPSLLLQAHQFESSGSWLEALNSYRSILLNTTFGEADTALASRNQVYVNASLGASRCLANIGCDGLLSAASQAPMILESQAMAARSLASWNLSQPTVEVAADPIDDFIKFSCKCALSDLSTRASQKKTEFWTNKLAPVSEMMMDRLITESNQESIKRMMKEVCRAQYCNEVKDYCELIEQSTSSSNTISTTTLCNAWRYKQNCNVDKSGQMESIISVRVDILRRILAGRRVGKGFNSIELSETWSLLDSLVGCVGSSSLAHACSPVIYKLRQHFLDDKGCVERTSTVNRPTEVVLRSMWFLQEARILWLKGVREAALSCIEAQVIGPLAKLSLTNTQSSSSSAIAVSSSSRHSRPPDNDVSYELLQDVRSEALRLRGYWAFSSKAEAGQHLADKFLNPAAALSWSPAQAVKCHEALATVFARLFTAARGRMHSSEWQQSERVAAARRAELDRCKKLLMDMKDKLKDKAAAAGNGSNPVPKQPEYPAEFKVLNKHVSLLSKEIALDDNEKQQYKDNLNSYLLSAIKSICVVLKVSSHPDLEFVLQLTNLWLSNCDKEEVNKLLLEEFEFVPSFKFVPVIYQLFSRLGDTSNTSVFQETLGKLLVRICRDHPHHSLLTLFALANATKVDLTGMKSNLSQGRCSAAERMIDKLKSLDGIASEVFATESLLGAYITLAMTSTDHLQKANKTKRIGFKELTGDSQRFDRSVSGQAVKPAVITRSAAINVDCNYKDIVRVASFASTFSITDSGISRPKIVECLGSDGCWYKQLVKGGDDMRQDAIMEQVFELVNSIFRKDNETRKRNLRIRTYKIVPTTPQTGVLEWVDNTIPFGQYLCDKESGAHKRYRPNDWTHSNCREHLSGTTHANERLERLKEIFASFQPAFRYFFMEKYSNPSLWVARRQAYTRSVAAASIVGYILGIGDRHSHNILIDEHSAEVIHIDFGIVFEQGKGLNTPETVPFRLTRDIVDGMGLSQCEGTFRRSCEAVLQVLRESTVHILTILEVVMHDPLYKWSLSPQQAQRRQPSLALDATLSRSLQQQIFQGPGATTTPRSIFQAGAGGEGATAGGETSFGRDAGERALGRVRSKLQGLDDTSGSGESLSVQGQVRALIAEARSPDNLCRLFPGWAPWV
jgi:hypothetical protein